MKYTPFPADPRLHRCMICGHEPTYKDVVEAGGETALESTTKFSVYCECGLTSPSGEAGNRQDAVDRWTELQSLIAAGLAHRRSLKF